MPESKVQSFIVKLWLEDQGEKTGSGKWHGYVTHVPSGERRYLKEFQDIVVFIKSYIGNGNTTFVSQVRRWWRS